jgi:hypothetical protein
VHRRNYPKAHEQFPLDSKMNASNKPPRYTPQQIGETVARIIDLRMRWLRVVETQLASRQNRHALDHSKIEAQPKNA